MILEFMLYIWRIATLTLVALKVLAAALIIWFITWSVIRFWNVARDIAEWFAWLF